MGKTRAEIQKAYRERLKAKLGDEYNARERERARKSYIPAELLNSKARKERNEKNKIRNRLSRQRQRDRLRALWIHESSDEDTSGYASNVMDTTPAPEDRSPQRLIVSLPSVQMAAKEKGAKKARARALARAHKTIRELKEDQIKLQRRLKSKTKQIERLNKRMKVDKSKSKLCTPERKAEEDISGINLTPSSRDKVKKKLITSHVLIGEITAAKKESSKKKHSVIHKVISGKLAKKYKCIKAISRQTGLSRNALGKSSGKTLSARKEVRQSVSSRIKHKVIEFLSREDNSRTQPGKADSKTENGTRKQIKVLTDYMQNLYQKFCAENPSLKISFATFCRIRPSNIYLARFISRNACQCLRHQNMALKIQALRKAGAKLRENPESILDHENNLDSITDCITEDTVSFKTWKRVEIAEKRMKMKIVEVKMDRETFIATVKREVKEFSEHVARLRAQFHQLKANKENLKEHHMIVQMDFAENYSCRYVDEPTCAYWKQTAVTLHPVVVYWKKDEKLMHKSYVVVSDELGHSASTVCAFLDVVIPELRKLDPELERIHYWTDSPSSQYRNRYIFDMLSKHQEIYNCDAQWNFFEAGHGKSACDGIGGLTKRMADEAVRQGNATIQDAQDFYKWGVCSSIKEVAFLFVSKEKCTEKAEEFSSVDASKVKNTMKLHAIAFQDNSFRTRETSCYCQQCITGSFCTSWCIIKQNHKLSEGTHALVRRKSVQKEGQKDSSVLSNQEDDVEMSNAEAQNEEMEIEENVFSSINVGDYVAAIYEKRWYIGTVDEIDREDRDCQINFMEKAKALFKWPNFPDKLWIREKDLICKIEKPQKVGKTGRLFKLNKSDSELVDNLFKSFTQI